MKIRVVIAAGLFFVSMTSWAGSWSSGGGNTVVCRDPQGKILSAEILDLYEGRVIRGLSYPASLAPYIEQAEHAAKAISNRPGITLLVSEMVSKTAKKFQFLPLGTALQPVNDSFEIVVPKGCEVVQTARYERDDTIYVDSEVWAAMNEQNRGALLMHEALYWILRLYGEQTSQRTRITVAHAFAGTIFPDVNADLPEEVEICQTDLSENGLPWAMFFSYPTLDKQGVVVQFVTFGGNIMLAKTTANLFGAKWPLSATSSLTLWYASLDSIVDAKVPFLIRVQPNADKTGSIDYQNGLKSPKRAFRCSVATK